MNTILKGMRVLDVSTYGAVPLAGVVLADWGAEVIKIEDPDSPDVMRGVRTWGIAPPPGASGHLYHLFNRGKRNAAINLKHPAGHAAFGRLVATADALLTNFMPGVRGRLRMDYDDVRAIKPDIVYGRNTGRGTLGQAAEQGGFDTTSYWARAGVSAATTSEEQPFPTGMPAQAFGDSQTGFALASGVVAGLLHRERTGEGMLVDTSLLATGMWAMQAAITGGTLVGREVRREKRGTGAPLNNPFRTKDDRFIHIGIDKQRYWESFCTAIGRPDLIDDPRMGTHQAREADPQHCVSELEKVFVTKTFAEWLAILPTQTGPYDPYQNAREVAEDPQALANGYVADVKDEADRVLKMIAPPVQFNQARYAAERGPAHGADTDDLLLEIGYSMDEILALKFDGAIL